MEDYYVGLINTMKIDMVKFKDELKVAQENTFAEMKEEWIKTQKNAIQTEIAKAKNEKIFGEIDCSEVKQCVLDDLNTLETEINAIEEKPRQVSCRY